jgi:ANTAR domain-containing protein/GAF domain-containing protein
VIEVDVATEQEWSEDRLHFALGTGSDHPAELNGAIGPLAYEFVHLAELLAVESTVRGVLQRVVDAARIAVPGADVVSVTLRTPGGFHTPVETDALATRLDEVQYELDEGPCVEATRTAGLGMTFSADLGAGREYPRFGPAAARLGVGSVLAVGLFPHGGDTPRMGALNVYSRKVDGLDELDRDIAFVLSAHASTALSATMASTAADLESAQLRQALSSRDVIGQAKGILMERFKLTADQAFQALARVSMDTNKKVREVAEKFVRTGELRRE